MEGHVFSEHLLSAVGQEMPFLHWGAGKLTCVYKILCWEKFVCLRGCSRDCWDAARGESEGSAEEHLLPR